MRKYDTLVSADLPVNADPMALLTGRKGQFRIRMLAYIAQECAESINGSVPWSSAREYIRECEEDYLRDTGALDANIQQYVINEVALLQRSGFLRRRQRYNPETQAYEEEAQPTGMMYHLLDCLVAMQKNDLEETQESNIPSARQNMRAVAARPCAVESYDLLRASVNELNRLIDHLSVFESMFHDFLDDLNTKIHVRSARDVNEWMTAVLRSPLVMEYFTITRSSVGYQAMVHEITRMAKALRNDATAIRSIALAGQQKVASTANAAADAEELEIYEDKVRRSLNQAIAVCSREYNDRMSAAEALITGVIVRMSNIMNSYGGGKGATTVTEWMIQLIRYCESCNEPIPASIFQMYECSVAVAESIPDPKSRTETVEHAVEIPEDTQEDEQERVKSITERTLEYAYANLGPGESKRLPEFACTSVEEYQYMIVLLCMASTGYEESEFEVLSGIEEDGKRTDIGAFIVPDLVIRRKQKGEYICG